MTESREQPKPKDQLSISSFKALHSELTTAQGRLPSDYLGTIQNPDYSSNPRPENLDSTFRNLEVAFESEVPQGLLQIITTTQLDTDYPDGRTYPYRKVYLVDPKAGIVILQDNKIYRRDPNFSDRRYKAMSSKECLQEIKKEAEKE